MASYKESLQNLKNAARYDSLYHNVIEERVDAELADNNKTLSTMHGFVSLKMTGLVEAVESAARGETEAREAAKVAAMKSDA